MRNHRRIAALWVVLSLVGLLLAPLSAGADSHPRIQVFSREEVRGSHFLGDTPISVQIDRIQGGSEVPIDFTTDGNGNFQLFLRDLAVGRLDVGDQVAVTQAALNKQVTVTAVEVLDSSNQTDTVWGLAAPNSPVEVFVEFGSDRVPRRVVADAQGSWMADYSIPGPAPDEIVVDFPHDITLAGEALSPSDADGDTSGWLWWTKTPFAWIGMNHVNGDGWADGVVNVLVDDPATAATDLAQAVPVVDGGFHLALPENFMQPGHLVEIGDGVLNASFIVPLLSITSVDPAADLISGVADPGLALVINVAADDLSAEAKIDLVVAADGKWQADFSSMVDITYGWNGSVQVQVADRADFSVFWQIPPPIITVNEPKDDISGRAWPLGFDIDIEIDDPAVAGEIADFAFSVTPVQYDLNREGGDFHRFIGDEFPLATGFVVTASNVAAGGNITKTFVVPRAEIASVQTSFDVVTGWTEPGERIEVFADNGRRTAVAGPDGWWEMDFGAAGGPEPDEQQLVDLQLGSFVELRLQPDEDGDFAWDTEVVQIQPGGGLPAITHTVGMVNPDHGLWRLLDEVGDEHSFYFGAPRDIPMMGDWDCDGDETPGLYRQSDGYVYLRNSNDTGPGEIRFTLGIPGDIPLAGDFNGDGCDTVAVYRPHEGHVYMTNVLGENEGFFVAEYDYFFGDPGDKPFVGDFDGDGVETVGLHRESTGFVYFRQTHTTGIADSEFFFGIPNDRIMAGDWDANYTDTVAIFRPGDQTLYFRNSNTLGVADETLEWGISTWLPVAGEFGLGP